MPNTYVIKKQLFSDILQNRCPKNFCKIHRKTPLMESVFNKAVDLKAWKFIKKKLQRRYFAYFLEKHLQNTSWWLLLLILLFQPKNFSMDHFFRFFLLFFPFNIDNCKYGSLFRKCIKMKVYLLFTIIYPKTTMNTVKTISQWQ